jgi:protein-tyrosine phosphatase
MAGVIVNFLTSDVTGLPGSIGMMAAPGVNRDLDRDLDALREKHKASLLITLVGDHEIEFLRLTDLRERAAARGIEALRFPIIDGSVPASMEAFIDLVRRILAEAEQGRTIIVHCWAGLGRTGLLAACCLVARGFDPGEAIVAVRRCRPRTIEYTEQEEFVFAFADEWAARRRSP